MIIDIAVEDCNADFKIHQNDANFPYKFNFLDRTTGIIVQVGLDFETYTELMKKTTGK